MKLQKYIIKAYYDTNHGVDVEVLPVLETSKEEIIRKIQTNMSMSSDFSLYEFDWAVKDIVKYGYDILTVAEFFGEV